MKQIPNIVTLLNLICGCIAIVFTLQNSIVLIPDDTNPLGQQLSVVPERIYIASLFIALAAVVDFLDGFVARLFNASSEMGKQLDSLADVISFGVAPSLMIYQLLRLSMAQQEDGLNAWFVWLVPAFILAAAAAYRLAKFNLDTRQTYSFRGTPVPSVGLMVASLPVIFYTTNIPAIRDLLINKWFLYGLVFVLSWLMVSDMPIMSNKLRHKTLMGNIEKVLLLAITVLAAIFFGWLAVPIAFVAFVVLSLIFKKQIQ